MRLFSGFAHDCATRFPSYLSEFGDAFHRKVAHSSFYLFFACLANAIALCVRDDDDPDQSI
jgi:hypothetical protein